MLNKKSQLDKPQGEKQKKPLGIDARMFTMPERYRHGAEAKLVEPTKKKKTTVAQIQSPAVPAPVPPKPKIKRGKKTNSTKVILIAGLIILFGLSAGSYMLLKYSQPQTDDTQEEIVIPEPRAEADVDKLEPEDEPVVEPEVEPDPFGVEVESGSDSDSDGLTDTEENLVYDTDPRLPDTDSDGFLDGNEVFHRYNPGGTAPGTLLDSGLVSVYNGQAGAEFYEFYYPTVWEIEEIGEELMLDAETGEGFRISVVEKSTSEDLVDWIEENITLDDYVEDTTKNGLDLIQSENLLVAYINLGTAVLVFEYDTGIKTRVDYLQTMKMMVNSVELIGVTSEVEDESVVDVEDGGEEGL